MLQTKKNLTRKERLSKSSDLIRMFKFAKRVETSGIKLLYLNNNLTLNRIAVVLKRGFKNSISRNREKRIVKECYRNLKNSLKIGWDIVLLIFPGTYSYSKRFSQISYLLKKSGLIQLKENM